MLKESESQFAQFFPGMIPVEGWKVGQATNALSWGRKPAAVYKLIELLVYSKTAHQGSRPSRRRGVRFVNGHII